MPFVKIKKCLTCKIPHEWWFEGPTLKELRMIKKLTGMTGMDYATAADTGDPDAVSALIYILHKRDKIEVPWDDIDLDFNDFEMEETEAEIAEREELEKANAGKEESPSENGQINKAVLTPK